MSSTSRGRHPPRMEPPESAFDIKEYRIKKHQKWIPVCVICKKSFPSWTEQAEHWKWKHRNKDLYTCKRCDKEFTSASSYKKHLLLHEEDKKRHACEKCGQCFDYPSQLERHSDVHLDKKMFKCPTWGCSKSFKRAETLKRHQINQIKRG